MENISCVCVNIPVQVYDITAELLLLLSPLLVLLVLIICWVIHLQWFFIQNPTQNRHPRIYKTWTIPRRLGHHLNLSLMPNSNHVSTGIKPLCSNIVFNKNPYHLATNQLTLIADQWTGSQWHESLLEGILEQKNTKASIPPGQKT